MYILSFLLFIIYVLDRSRFYQKKILMINNINTICMDAAIEII